MPLLWGLFSLSTVVEIGFVAVLGKVASGSVGGLPGFMWPADKLVRGLMFLRPPSEEELRAHDLHKQKRGGPVALSCDSVVRGDLYSIPFSMGLMALMNAAAALFIMLPMRVFYDYTVKQTTAIPNTRSFNFSLVDSATIILLLISVILLTTLQRSCYSNNESIGLAGTWAAVISGIAAFGTICTEELSFIGLKLHEGLLDFNSYQEGLPTSVSETLPWYYSLTLPGYVISYALSSLCIMMSYGLTGATWRLVRTHYQFCDRQESTLSTIEENRAKFLLEYKLGKVNVHDAQAPPITNPLPPSEIPRHYYAFFLKVLSIASLLLPFLITFTFGGSILGYPPQTARFVLCGVIVVVRGYLLRTYLQTYLHRDVNDSSVQGKSSKQLAETLSNLHYRALMLLARTAIIIVAPVGVYFSIFVFTLRLTLLDSSETDPTHRLANILPARLIEHEYAADPSRVAPKNCFFSMINALLFWLAASETIFIFCYCSYRWLSRVLTSYRYPRRG